MKDISQDSQATLDACDAVYQLNTFPSIGTMLNLDCWATIISILEEEEDFETLQACSLVGRICRRLAQVALFRSRIIWLGREDTTSGPSGRLDVAVKDFNHENLMWTRHRDNGGLMNLAFLPAVNLPPPAVNLPSPVANLRVKGFAWFFRAHPLLAQQVSWLEYDLLPLMQRVVYLKDRFPQNHPSLWLVLAPIFAASLPRLGFLRLLNWTRPPTGALWTHAVQFTTAMAYAPILTGVDSSVGIYLPALRRPQLVDLILYDWPTLKNLICSLPALEDLLVCRITFADYSDWPSADPAREPKTVSLKSLHLQDTSFVLEDGNDMHFISDMNRELPIVILQWLARTPSANTLKDITIEVWANRDGYPSELVLAASTPAEGALNLDLRVEYWVAGKLKCLPCLGRDSWPRQIHV
jgi:hypothetical protein